MLEVLRCNPMFQGLADEDLQTLASHAKTRRFPRHTIVISQGDVSDNLYIIVDGRVSVYLDDGNGKEVTLNTLGPNDSFGELAPLANIPRVASIKTLDDARLISISRAALFEVLSANPNMGMRIIALLIQRIQDLTDEVASFALLDVYGRVIRVLKRLAIDQGGRLEVHELSQQDIAKRVGASREMVNRIFKELKAGGYVSLEGGNIIIEKELPSGW